MLDTILNSDWNFYNFFTFQMRLGSAFGAFLDPVADKVLPFLSSKRLTLSMSISASWNERSALVIAIIIIKLFYSSTVF